MLNEPSTETSNAATADIGGMAGALGLMAGLAPEPADTPVVPASDTPADPAQEVTPAPESAETAPAGDTPAETEVEYTPEEREALVELLDQFVKSGKPGAPVEAPAAPAPSAEAPAQQPQQPPQQVNQGVVPQFDMQIPEEVAESLIIGDPAPLGQWVGGQIQAAQNQFAGNFVQHVAQTLPVIVGNMVEVAVATALAQKENPLLAEHHESVIRAVNEAREANPNASTPKLVEDVLKRMDKEIVTATALAKFRKSGGKFDGRASAPVAGARPNARNNAPTAPGKPVAVNPMAQALGMMVGLKPTE